MSKIKEAVTNVELLKEVFTKALAQKKITTEEIKELEGQLKRDFPHVHYDFSEFYKEESEE